MENHGKSCGITEDLRLIDADQCWQSMLGADKRLVIFVWMVQCCLGLGKTEGKLAQLTQTGQELVESTSRARFMLHHWWVGKKHHQFVDHAGLGLRESQGITGIPGNSHANSESITWNDMLWTYYEFLTNSTKTYQEPSCPKKDLVQHSATWHDAMAHVISIGFARFARSTIWQSSGAVPQRRNPSQRPTLRCEFRRREFPHSHVDLQLDFSGTRLNHCTTADWRSFRVPC